MNDARNTAPRNGKGAYDIRPLYLNCDAYLFDIDGTLLNSRDAVHYCAFHHAVRDVFGIELRLDGVPVHGNTDIGILRAALKRDGISDSEFEAKLPLALQQMCAEATKNAHNMTPEVCPSVRNLLDSLRRAGKLMGVASGNLATIGWLKLKAAGLDEFFAFGSFSDNAEFRADVFRNGVSEVRQRLREDASVCVVGDTPSDVKAAREAGLSVIAVATGIFPMEELSQLHPDACVSCCTELLPHF